MYQDFYFSYNELLNHKMGQVVCKSCMLVCSYRDTEVLNCVNIHIDLDKLIVNQLHNTFCTLPIQINLKAGRNVIIWQATAITYGGKHDNRDPVFIKSIEIQGLKWVLLKNSTLDS